MIKLFVLYELYHSHCVCQLICETFAHVFKKVNLDDAKTYGFYAVNAHECHLGVKIRTFRCVFEICFACENCLDGFYIKIVCCFFNFTLESMATSKLGASQSAYYE